MAASEPSHEASMLKGVIDVIACIVPASVMTNPCFAIDVRNVGMPRLITVVPILFHWMWRDRRPGAAFGNGRVRAASAALMMLGECRYGKDKQRCKC
jgi:hypothetical protein